ncbi:MAG: hypothetical protein K2H62_01090 [Bacteroidales bacterium]|nr:hypothetical protein [Bacteroidales bacterium]
METKAADLRRKVADLEVELKKSRARLSEQEAKLQIYKQKINDLTNRNQILKVSSALARPSSQKGNPAVGKILSELIAEVDRCITLLDR